MASLADLVLDSNDLDELDKIEDEDLAREIQELNALREAVNPGSRPSTGATGAPAAAANSHTSNVAVPRKAAAARQREGLSLADKILDAPDGVDDVDREFQSMEEELQQQLLKYKEQCEDSERKAAPQAPPAGPAQDASTTAGSTSWPSRPSSKSSAHGSKEAALPNAAGTEDAAGGEAITPELLNLRVDAERMEEAFPEPENLSHETPSQEAPTRSRRRRGGRAGYERSHDPAPEAHEIVDLKQQLSSLDIRMTAIQQKHAMHDDILNGASKPELPPAAARAVAELKAQNAHLRERFQAADKRGLLRLDGSLFGASSEKKPKGTTAGQVGGGSDAVGAGEGNL